MGNHITIERNFVPVGEDGAESADYLSVLWSTGRKKIVWPDLLKEFRVIVLAPAGSGKTHEMRQLTKELIDKGKWAFFFRIEDLGEQSIEEALEGSLGSVDDWLDCDVPGYFFLDSVDEARLTNQQNFRRALKKLSKKIIGQVHRAHIFISSRPFPEWRPMEDVTTFREYFPHPEISEKVNMPSDKTTPMSVNSAPNKEENEKPEVKVYQLDGLNPQQIGQFAFELGVTDTSTFADALRRSNLEELASRPQDLLALAQYWLQKDKFAAYRDMLEFSIDERLAENNRDIEPHVMLSKEQAQFGAERIAAALTFSRANAFVRKSGDLGDEAADDAVRLDKLLPDWSPELQRNLMARPVFEPSSYGCARFYHRDSREFLTARWLAKLLKDGKSRRAIEQLILPERYGQTVTPPSMRPIAAWLALFDDSIREKLLFHAPDLLVSEGDPGALDSKSKIELLKRFAGFTDSEHRHIFVDLRMVERLADSRLGPTVRELLISHKDNQKVRDLMLRMVWQGKLTCCADIAFETAIDLKTDKYSRIVAIRALKDIGTDKQLQLLTNALVNDSTGWHYRVIAEVIGILFPKFLAPEELTVILSSIREPSSHGTSPLDNTLATIVAETCPDNLLLPLLKNLADLIRLPPLIGNYCKSSSKNSWLIQYAAKLAERYLTENPSGPYDNDLLYILEIEGAAIHYNIPAFRDIKNDLANLILNHTELRRILFWRAVNQEREERKPKDRPIDHWWNGLYRVPFVHQLSSGDFDHFLEALNEKKLMDDKLIALGAAVQIRIQENRDRKLLYRIKKAVKGNKRLEQRLHEYLNPKPMTEEEKKSRRQEQAYKKSRKDKEARDQKIRKEWVSALKAHPHRLRSVNEKNLKHLFTDLYYLSHEIRRQTESKSRWGCADWELLIPEFGREVAECLCVGLKAYWRIYRSQTLSDGGQTTHGTEVALAGLAIEAKSEAEWAKKLSAEEAQTAITHAMHEMNGQPDWLPDVLRAHPTVCDNIIKRELEWEFAYDDEPLPHHLLSDMRYGADALRERYLPAVWDLFYRAEPKHFEALDNSLRILLRWDNLDVKKIAALAKDRFLVAVEEGPRLTWLVAWFCVEAEGAFAELKKWIEDAETKEESTHRAIKFCSALMSHHELRFPSEHRDFEQIAFLRKFVPFLYQQIRQEYDRNHEGSYTPDERDNAETTRSHMLGKVYDIGGLEAYQTLLYFAECLPNQESRDRMFELAYQRAALDAEQNPWCEDDIVSFAYEAEKDPQTLRELYDLILCRLDDIKLDLEEGDASEAALLQKAENEPQLRLWFGKRLREQSRGRHSVPQEEELADGKKPDLRVHLPVINGTIPIEVKIAENWTYSKLCERLENQLIGQYMRDANSRFGIFLLIRKGGGKSKWKPADSGALDFDRLIPALQNYAIELVKANPDIEEIKVIGVDLQARTHR